MLIYACDVYRTLYIDWQRGTTFQVFSGGKAISSMNDLMEAYLKRERECRCRLLVMSSWRDDGALVMRWKKANEARRTKLTLHLESLKKMMLFFFLICFFSLFDHIVQNRKIADMYIDTIFASVLFETQLLHDTRHFVQSLLALDYSFIVSFLSVPFLLFKMFIGVSCLGDMCFLGFEERGRVLKLSNCLSF